MRAAIRRPIPLSAIALWLVLLLAETIPSFAQFAQYTPPGSAGAPVEDRQERLENAVSEARFRLGPVRLDPWFALHDVGYVNDRSTVSNDRKSQLSATAGGGLRAYLPSGPKVIWAAHALPEYVWAEDPALRRTNGRFGLGGFAFFNRLTLEATVGRSQQLAIATPEVLRRANQRTDRLTAAAEVRLAGAFYGFADIARSTIENQVEAGTVGLANLGNLDRRERTVRAGLRLRSRRGFWIGVGVERSQVDFDAATDSRSNQGTAPIVEVMFPEGGDLDIAISLAWRSLEPRDESSFEAFDGLTGTLRLGLAGDRRLKPGVYASRNLVYTLTRTASYIESDRYGVSLTGRLGHRSSALLFFERGRDAYVAGGAAAARSDDETAYGAGYELNLRGQLGLQMGLSREEYSSAVPDGDRALTTVRVGLTFGSSRSPWY